MNEPRAKTKEEMLENLIFTLYRHTNYFITTRRLTAKEKCMEIVKFFLVAVVDGLDSDLGFFKCVMPDGTLLNKDIEKKLGNSHQYPYKRINDVRLRNFVKQLRQEAKSFSTIEKLSRTSVPDFDYVREMCHGLMENILAYVDGINPLNGKITLVSSSHVDERDTDRRLGMNWIPDGVIINDNCLLREEYMKLAEKKQLEGN